MRTARRRRRQRSLYASQEKPERASISALSCFSSRASSSLSPPRASACAPGRSRSNSKSNDRPGGPIPGAPASRDGMRDHLDVVANHVVAWVQLKCFPPGFKCFLTLLPLVVEVPELGVQVVAELRGDPRRAFVMFEGVVEKLLLVGQVAQALVRLRERRVLLRRLAVSAFRLGEIAAPLRDQSRQQV